MQAKLFISYSHRDESFKNELESHLAPLRNQGLIEAWSDRMIMPGEEGDKVIDLNLARANIILLLISADFCNSLYCWQKELEQSLRRHEARQAIVIPIIIRACDLQGASFEVLQSLPTDRKPVSAWSNRDEAWTDVAGGIRKAVESTRDLQRRSQTSSELQQVLRSNRANPRAYNGLKLGYVDLDNLLSGLLPSELMVIAGRPGMGKTTFALNIALHVVFSKEHPVPVALFSMENACEAVTQRLISALARVNSYQLHSGQLSEDSWPRIDGAMSLLSNAPLYVDETATIAPADIAVRVEKLKNERDIGLIIIDQLQMLRSSRNRDDHGLNETSDIVRELKAIARELDMPIIFTSQVDRSVDRRVEKRPILSDLPEGYDVEVYADIITFILREEVYDPYTPRRGMADIVVAKNRKGMTGDVNLIFTPAHGRFDNYMPDSAAPIS